MWRILARAGRILAWVTLVCALTVAAAAIVVVVLARTETGHRIARRALAPILSSKLNGAEVTIGGVGGDLLRHPVLDDVAVRDPTGKVAVRIRRLALDYRLWPLVHRRVEIASLRGEGIELHLRRLPNGRLNLRALVPPAKEGGRSFEIHLDRAALAGRVSWAQASASFSVAGGLAVVDGVPSVDDLRAEIDLAAKERIALARRLTLRGPLEIELHAGGAPSQLAIELTARPARGSIALEGELSLAAPGGLTWHGTLAARALDPAALLEGAPPGRLEADATAHGEGSRATIAIDRISARAAASRLEAHGELGLEPFSARLIIDASSRDLSRLATLGLPALGGELSVHARLSRAARHTRIDADLRGHRLEVATAQVGELDAHLHARDLRGRARLAARDLTVPSPYGAPVELDTLNLAVSGDRASLALTLAAHGPGGATVAIDAHGRPLRDGRGADVTIDRLLAVLHGQRAELIAPGRLRLSQNLVTTRIGLRLSSPALGPRPIALRVDAWVQDRRLRGALTASSGKERLRMRADLPLTRAGDRKATAEVRLLDLDLAQLRPLLPPSLDRVRGQLTAELRLEGTTRHPKIDLQAGGTVDASRLAGKEDLGPLKVAASATLHGGKAQASFDARLRDAPLLHATAASRLDLGRLTRAQVGKLPITFEATIASYDLSRLPKLAGVIAGDLQVTGTLAHPRGSGRIQVTGLRAGESRLTRLTARLTLDGTRLHTRLDASEPQGGRLSLDATLPLDRDAPLAATLEATRFHLAFRSLGPVRALGATLDAKLEVKGSRAAPEPRGHIAVANGSLAFRSDPHLYRAIAIDLGVAPGELTIQRVSLKAGSGSAEATGRARLAGLLPTTFEAQVTSRRFPIASGSVSTFIDSKIDVHGELHHRLVTGVITVREGVAHLPRIGGRKLQPTGPLDDVVYVDAEARRAAEARARARQKLDRWRIHADAHIPGPFKVRSQELRADLHGDLGIDLVGTLARIDGDIESAVGSVELLGRRYRLERARIGFAGRAPPDPNIDLRLTRQITQAKLIIEIHGTARDPKLALASDPPIFDQAQLVGLIVSGDPGSPRVSERGLSDKVVGAVSSVIVNRIKSQILPGLPIDVITFESGTGPLGSSTSRLEVGKYLTDQIFVSYVYQFGAPVGLRRVNSNEARLDYRFARHFEINTVYGDAGVGALDFYWTVRF